MTHVFHPVMLAQSSILKILDVIREVKSMKLYLLDMKLNKIISLTPTTMVLYTTEVLVNTNLLPRTTEVGTRVVLPQIIRLKLQIRRGACLDRPRIIKRTEIMEGTLSLNHRAKALFKEN